MGRMYTIFFEGVAVSALQDLFEILAPSDSTMRLHAVFISQSSDAGDSQSEQIGITISRVTGSPTSGSGGSSATPSALNAGDPAAGITAEVNNTTQLSGGTKTTLHRESFNVMAGIQLIFTPEMRPSFSPSTYCLIEINAAPGDALTMDGVVYIEEVG